MYETPNLSLAVLPQKDKIQLDFVVPENLISTHVFPHTYQLLKKHQPSVLDTKCFNPNNFSFKREVKATQTAHLFEHLLLDLIVAQKSQATEGPIKLSGHTWWDWTKEKVGQFHIEINLDLNDHHFLNSTIPQALDLMTTILNPQLALSPKQAD